MWGIVPAAGTGSRIQPLAFSKELLPVGSRMDGAQERPRAVSEYLIERMIRAGVNNICFVLSPGKTDILEYFGGQIGPAHVCYTVQPEAAGLCDAIFRALPFIERGEDVVVGLPDTIWFPEDGLRALPKDELSFLLFPVEQPGLFDSVITDASGRVTRIDVKSAAPETNWIWGAFRAPANILRGLFELWSGASHQDEYFGTLVNAFLARGGRASAVRAGEAYVDVGTVNGYRQALRLLEPTARLVNVAAAGRR